MSEQKPSRSWTVAPNYRIADTLFDLTVQVAFDVFGLVEGKHYRIQRSFPKQIDFSPMRLNHRMMFLTADRPELFVSESITHWRWSEVATSKALVLEKIQDRLRDKRAKLLQGMGDSTPEGTDNHFYELAGFGGASSDCVDKKRNFRKFRVETGDNAKNLAPGYLEALRARYAYSADRLKAYEKGLFTTFRRASAAYPEFYESRNVVSTVPADPEMPLLFTWDFNVNPLAWVVMQRHAVQKHLGPRYFRFTALAESSGESRGLKDAVDEFARKFPVAKFMYTPIDVHGDRSGYNRAHNTPGCDYDQISKYLVTHGYQRVTIKAQKANPEIRPTLEKVSALMAYDMYAVTADCRRLIESHAKTSLKDGTWQIDKPPGDTWTHFADAARYCLYELTKGLDITNPNNQPLRGFSI